MNKSISHLIINIVISVQVNLLIDNELLFHSELKNCELYHNNYRLTQCFNCQKYDHTVKICWNIQKYRICAVFEHSDHNFLLKNSLSAHCYVNYNFKHAAWFIKCRICKEQLKKIWLIYTIKFRKFVVVINKNHSANAYFFIFSLFTFSQIFQDS